VGKIVFTCQIFGEGLQDQICVMAPDGGDWRRLTSDDEADHFYPSLSPDGRTALFSSNMEGDYDIFELSIHGGTARRLTSLGEAYAPDVSPDNLHIVFTHVMDGSPWLWRMDRDGTSPAPLVSDAWDAAWSPDSQRILHASDRGGSTQLWTISRDGSDLRQITELANLRGRNDWSPDGQWMASYAGEPWEREIVIFDALGGSIKQLTEGGNNLAPSFSPDGNWITFTSYVDSYRDENGCEIYVMHIQSLTTFRLTENSYCDWQPRWGP
jgi:TolB protein